MTCDEVDQVSAVDNGQPIRPVPEIPLSAVRTAADFAECLDQLRVLAGPLSHRQIESRSSGRLRRTKIGQVLNGELPRREFLAAYLEVCGVTDAAKEPWHRVWAHLISTAQGWRQSAAGISEDGDALVLRKERDAALAQVQRLLDELEMLQSAAREVDADPKMRRLIAPDPDTELATMIVRIGEPGGLDKQVMDELQTLRAERDAADRRARRLGELNDSIVVRLRTAETARDEAETARDEALNRVKQLSQDLEAAQVRITELTDAAAARPRPAKYTQMDKDIYDPPTQVPPPVLGE